MTIETSDTYVRLTIDGTGPYEFDFRIFDETDVAVSIVDNELSPVALTLNTHYTVSGVDVASGGSITLINDTETTYDGSALDIRSNTQEYQPTSIRNQGAFLPEIHEDAFDRLSRQVQDLRRVVSSCLRPPDTGVANGAMTPLSDWAGQWIYVNESGQFEPATGITAQPLSQSIIGTLLDPRTQAEITATVIPSNYAKGPLQTLQRETNRYSSVTQALSVLETGLVTEPVYYIEDWGAPCNGTDDDAPALNALIQSLYNIDIHTTSNFRRAVPIIQLPARGLTLLTNLDIGKTLGTMGLTIRGCGAWATSIRIATGVTISGYGCSHIRWQNIAFRATEIDSDVTAFTLTTASGGALRRWTFDHCDFYNIYRSFLVNGSSLCDEFKFIGCNWLQCYYLMDNNNDQAVNWNFYGCDWEHELAGTTAKDVDDAAIFKLQKGTLVNWSGGSLLVDGRIVYVNTTNSNDISINAHAINFEGVRIELIDNAGTHAPLVQEVSSGYAVVNPLKFTLQDFTLLHRGTLPTTMTLFRLRDNWTVMLRNGETEGGYVDGIFDNVTSSNAASLTVDNVVGITYREVTTGRVSVQDKHNVTLIPNQVSDRHVPPVVMRSGGSTGVAYAPMQTLYVRSSANDGNIPAGGTTVNLPTFPNHTMLIELGLQLFATTAQNITVQLRDQADTTTYADVTINAGAGGGRQQTDPTALEVGFQLGTESVPVPLMLKFVGTPDTQKGVVWVKYL